MLKLKPSLWSFILQPEVTDEEHFEDVLEDNGDTILLPPPGPEGASKDCVTVEDKGGMDVVAGKLTQLQGRQQYRVGHRNPLYCGAERTCLWELASVSNKTWHHCGMVSIPLSLDPQLSCHYHPSVQVFARKIATVSISQPCGTHAIIWLVTSECSEDSFSTWHLTLPSCIEDSNAKTVMLRQYL